MIPAARGRGAGIVSPRADNGNVKYASAPDVGNNRAPRQNLWAERAEVFSEYIEVFSDRIGCTRHSERYPVSLEFEEARAQKVS
jgi:hypothetical protein